MWSINFKFVENWDYLQYYVFILLLLLFEELEEMYSLFS